MTWNEVIHKFLQMVEKIKSLKPAYRQPGDGSDGTCDCIGLLIGAIRRMGLKWTGIHGSNWAARKEFVKLKKITSLSELELGDGILKALEKGESGWALPARYQNGGQYYNGDLRDYYHAGVVTNLNPVQITNMSSPTVKVLTVKTMKDLGRWGYHGRLRILANAAGKKTSTPTTTQPTQTTTPVPSTGSTAVVVSSNGAPVKMRQYPSTSCRTWDKVIVGSKVTIVSPGEKWAKINYGRRKGWYMMSEFLDIVGDGKGKY